MRVAIVLTLSLIIASAGRSADWPQLLGPRMNGSAEGSKIEAFSGRKPPIAWQAVVGFGSAPAVIAGGRGYVVGLYRPNTSERDLDKAEAAPTLDDIGGGNFPARNLPGTPKGVAAADYPSAYRGDLYAQCFDVATGRRLWSTKLTDFGLAFKTNKHGGTGWEVASPLIADGRLFVHTHTGRVFALDGKTGNEIWQRNLFDHRMSTWFGGQQGNSSAPIKSGDAILVSYDIDGCLGVAAFDARTGAERWIARAPKHGMNARASRISIAMLDGKTTALCSCGSGTMGLDPATGQRRWWFDLIEANPETMKKVPARFAETAKSERDYRVDALRVPFPGFCPLSWNDYVLDAACVGHNSMNSATWCLKIKGDQVVRVWQTSDFVTTSASLKSSMAVRDGKVYGFDSYFPGFARQYDVTRPYRGTAIGEFQCRDVATGKLLWSSDAFNPTPPGPQRADSTNAAIIVTDSALLVVNNHGLWIGRARPDGIDILTHVPQAPGKLARMLSEPALADGRLLLRQLDALPKAGLSSTLGGSGNLFCFELKSRASSDVDTKNR